MTRRACTVLLLAASSPLLAAEPPDDLFALDLESLSQVRVNTATRRDEPLSQIPATVLVIDAAAIHRRGYRHLGELLAALPGIDLQQYSSVTFYNRVAVRGLTGNNKLLILQDGVRIGPPAGEPTPIANNFPLHHIRQVEVVYGPASAVYGADAMTAVVNLVSADPADSTLALSAGEAASRYASVSTGGQHERWRWHLAGHRQQSDGADLQDAYPDVFRFTDLRNFGGTVVVPLAERNSYNNASDSESLTATLHHDSGAELGLHHSSIDTPTTAGDRPGSANYGSEWMSRVDTVYLRQQLRWDNGSHLIALLDYSHYEVDPDTAFNNIFSAFSKVYKYAESERREFDLQWGMPLSSSDYLTAGLNYQQIDALPKTADLAKPFRPDHSAIEQGLFYAGTNDSLPIQIFHVDQQQRGGFVQWQRDWSEHWHSLLGVRVDHSDSWAEQTTPRFGIQYRSGERWRSHLSYSEAYLAPSPLFVYEHFGAFNGTQDNQGRYISSFFQVPNLDLQPETLHTTELGFHWQGERNWAIAGALYQSQLDNLIGLVPMATPDADFVPGGVILASQQWDNVGDVDLLGADLWWQWQQRIDSQQWQFSVGLSAIDGTLNTGMNEALPYVGQHKLKMAISWQHDQGWFANLNVQASSRVKVLDNATLPEDESVPGFAVANLLFGHNQLAEGLELQLRVDNLFDTRYYNAGTGTRTTLVASPQDPRLISLGLQYRF